MGLFPGEGIPAKGSFASLFSHAGNKIKPDTKTREKYLLSAHHFKKGPGIVIGNFTGSC